MAKKQKTLRFDAELCDRVSALQSAGESESVTYSRVVRAGLEVLEGRVTPDNAEPATDAHTGEKPAPDATVAALTATVEAMTADAAALRDQLDKKDRQISELQTIATNAQMLHAATTKALETSEAKARRGLLSRIRDYFTGPALPESSTNKEG